MAQVYIAIEAMRITPLVEVRSSQKIKNNIRRYILYLPPVHSILIERQMSDKWCVAMHMASLKVQRWYVYPCPR